MAIDAKLVAELRRHTGLPMMKCKSALVEAGGDIEAAIEALRKQGVKAAETVAHRELKEGRVFLHSDESGACAVSLLCQTDFVAMSDEVVAFGEALVEDLFEHAPADAGTGESLGDYTMADGTGLHAKHEELALKIGENIRVGSYARYRPEPGLVCTYVHHNGKIACMVEFGGEGLAASDPVQELGRDLGMQIAFHGNVKALRREDLDQEWVAKEREIFYAQTLNMPEEKRDQITEGKLSKRLMDVVLLEQPFIRNDRETVSERIEAVAKETVSQLTIQRFARVAAGV